MDNSKLDAGAPVRVLHVVQRMEAGGTQAMLMNLYRNIDRSKVQFDFLVLYEEPQFHDAEIKSLGGRIYRTSLREDGNIPKFIGKLRTVLANTNYEVMHVHAYTVGYLALREAKRYGVTHRIAHSHNNQATKDFKLPVKLFMQRIFTRYANENFACSQQAGEYLFRGEPFTVLPNAIDVDSFKYDAEVRREVRSELGLGSALVVGHVGRMHRQKNHGFLLEAFAALQKSEPDAALVLVGAGTLESQIRQKVNDMGLRNVQFLGNRDDMDRLYQAFDVFVLPSVFEGLGIVAVEAQASGCPTIVSDGVPPETTVTEVCRTVPLSAGPEAWAQAMGEARIDEDVRCRQEAAASVAAAGFDIKESAKTMQERYLRMRG